MHSSPFKDKKYASDKYKDIYTELSNVKAKAECDITRLKEQLKTATEMLGEKTPETASVSGYGESISRPLLLSRQGFERFASPIVTNS